MSELRQLKAENALLRRFAAFVYSAWSEDTTCAQWHMYSAELVPRVMAWLEHFDGMDLQDADLDIFADVDGFIPALCEYIRSRTQMPGAKP